MIRVVIWGPLLQWSSLQRPALPYYASPGGSLALWIMDARPSVSDWVIYVRRFYWPCLSFFFPSPCGRTFRKKDDILIGREFEISKLLKQMFVEVFTALFFFPSQSRAGFFSFPVTRDKLIIHSFSISPSLVNVRQIFNIYLTYDGIISVDMQFHIYVE